MELQFDNALFLSMYLHVSQSPDIPQPPNSRLVQSVSLVASRGEHNNEQEQHHAQGLRPRLAGQTKPVGPSEAAARHILLNERPHFSFRYVHSANHWRRLTRYIVRTRIGSAAWTIISNEASWGPASQPTVERWNPTSLMRSGL